MRRMMFRSSAWVCVVAVGLLACEVDIALEDGEGGEPEVGGAPGDGGSTSSDPTTDAGGFGGTAPSPLQAACDRYCAQAEPKGCPEQPGCEVACLGLAAVGCHEPLTEFLECAGTLLGPDCVVGYPDNAVGGNCIDADDRLDSCVFEAGSCSRVSSDALPNGGCEGSASCHGEERLVSCDDTGHCLCFDSGSLAGTCTSIMSGIELCSPLTSCCAQYF